jgi:hypothetical protein
MWKLAALLLAGCAGVAPAPRAAVLSNAVPLAGSGALFQLGVESLGPIVPSTPVTEEALQALLGSHYTVKIVDRSGDEVHVSLRDELLFYVIPTEEGTLFNVHVVSPKIAIAEHPEWIIHSPFVNAEPLTACECWGQHPVCFRAGDHVAVAFEIDCGGLATPAERQQHLIGVPIQRAVWNPQPFGGPARFDPDPSAPPDLSKLFGGDPP